VVSGAKYEERAKEKTRDAACNDDALAFSQILIWLLPNTSHHSPLTSFISISFGCKADFSNNLLIYKDYQSNLIIQKNTNKNDYTYPVII